MIPGEWIGIARVLHGAFNILVAVALLHQGWLGLKIRRARRKGGAKDFGVIKRHRGRGPVLALLGILGYAMGATLIAIDKGRLFEYPLHHVTGLSIVILLAMTFLVSRQIKGPDSPWRTPHLLLGVAILGAYLAQLFLGLNILL
ncbi:MAG TPA: hypothetical protein DCZ97_05450 [Syntrophus sp. (in: bacteria)]|nr:hypothetical protein [Syntrophus sp. (in: bacteria)]